MERSALREEWRMMTIGQKLLGMGIVEEEEEDWGAEAVASEKMSTGLLTGSAIVNEISENWYESSRRDMKYASILASHMSNEMRCLEAGAKEVEVRATLEALHLVASIRWEQVVYEG
ncbi:hypothetical protein LINPERHAP1_LOCUS20685 [Linum perenne]